MRDERRPVLGVFLLAMASAMIHGEASGQGVAGAASNWTVSPEPERVHGWLEGEPDSDFSDIVGVAHGPDGSIAVADRLLAQITVLSADGTVLVAMGREGDGPGEFRSLSGLVVDREGRLVVFDDSHQRLSEWTFDGTLVGDTRLRREGTDRQIGAVGQFADGSRYASESDRLVATDVGGVGRDTVGYHRLGDDGAVGDALVRVPGSVTSMFSAGGMPPGIRGALFSPRALGATRGNCLLAGASDGPVLQIFDRTGVARGELRLEVQVDRATEDHRKRWISETIASFERMSGDEVSPQQTRMVEAMGEAVGMAERIPFAYDLIVDDLGYVWIQPYQLPDGPGNSEWRVFAETGQAIGPVQLPEGLRALAISTDAILGVRRDDLGRQFVQVHALDRRGDVESRPLPPGCG
ncbi:6-bladed beta-propeller [Candidatus Palauibacter sp.]|uniref:6-bladed beta-propeller n=1 Tax=Candidatus Palauibacter sp. TaxID=3101350 RepID=UPI003B0273A7